MKLVLPKVLEEVDDEGEIEGRTRLGARQAQAIEGNLEDGTLGAIGGEDGSVEFDAEAHGLGGGFGAGGEWDERYCAEERSRKSGQRAKDRADGWFHEEFVFGTSSLNHETAHGLSAHGQPIVRELSWTRYASAPSAAARTSAKGVSTAAPKR